MSYSCRVYDSFKSFLTAHPDVAQKLKDEVPDGDWIEGEICYYPTMEDFCKYELTDGWYIEHNLNMDFRGAPNPMDYIDYKRFAVALMDSWDDSCNWTDGECVVTTAWGW